MDTFILLVISMGLGAGAALLQTGRKDDMMSGAVVFGSMIFAVLRAVCP